MYCLKVFYGLKISFLCNQSKCLDERKGPACNQVLYQKVSYILSQRIVKLWLGVFFQNCNMVSFIHTDGKISWNGWTFSRLVVFDSATLLCSFDLPSICANARKESQISRLCGLKVIQQNWRMLSCSKDFTSCSFICTNHYLFLLGLWEKKCHLRL